MCDKSGNQFIKILSDLFTLIKVNGLSSAVIVFLMGMLIYQSRNAREFTTAYKNNTQSIINTLIITSDKYGDLNVEVTRLENKIDNVTIALGVLNRKQDEVIECQSIIIKQQDCVWNKIDSLKTVTVYENQMTRAGGSK